MRTAAPAWTLLPRVILYALFVLAVWPLAGCLHQTGGAALKAAATAPGTHQDVGERPSEPGPDSTQAIRIIALHRPDRLVAGAFEHYSVRVAPGSGQPIVYRWAMGDGTLATGNYITHRYRQPGRYEIIVTVRNQRGFDADTLVVTVAEPPTETPREAPPARAVADTHTPSAMTSDQPAAEEPEAPPALNPVEAGLRGARIDWPRGGYTLVAATRMASREAEAVALRYRRAGYRAGIVVDTDGPGSTVYRILVGQFAGEQAAVAGRRLMLAKEPGGAFIVEALPAGGKPINF